jgi:hypothetical protein
MTNEMGGTVGTALAAAILLTLASCKSDDQRLTEEAQRAAEQQARQNERIAQQADAMVKHSHEMTAAAHDLVENDAAARRELIQAQEKVQHDNHVERRSLDQERQQLVADQKQFGQAAVQNPVIAQAVISGSLILAALMPLLVTLYALRRLPPERPTDDFVSDGLLQELLLNPVAIQPGSTASPSLDAGRASSLFGPADDESADVPPPF